MWYLLSNGKKNILIQMIKKLYHTIKNKKLEINKSKCIKSKHCGRTQSDFNI